MPQCNIPFEMHLFRQITQLENESMNEFIIRLRHQASNRNFGNTLDEQIRDQVVEKCYSRDLRAKFLEKTDLKLTDIAAIAKSFEAVANQLKSMDKPVEFGANKRRGRKTLIRCGLSLNVKLKNLIERCATLAVDQVIFIGTDSVELEEKKCFKCQRYGHYQAQCRSSIDTSSNSMAKSNKRSNLNCLEEKCVSRRAMKQPDANYVPCLTFLQ